MGSEVLILLLNVAAPAVDIDVYGGGVAPDASVGCKVNFKAKAVAAGRPGHTTEGWGFTGRHYPFSIQRDFKGDSSCSRADKGENSVMGVDRKLLHIYRPTNSTFLAQL